MKILLENPDLSEQYIVNMYVIFRSSLEHSICGSLFELWLLAWLTAVRFMAYELGWSVGG